MLRALRRPVYDGYGCVCRGQRVRAVQGYTESALSAMRIIELTHGIYRAKAVANRVRRNAFADEFGDRKKCGGDRP